MQINKQTNLDCNHQREKEAILFQTRLEKNVKQRV